MVFNTLIKKLFIIYFTAFPYNYYNYANSKGNFGLAGIGYGLINVQKWFWLLNIGFIIYIYNLRNINFYYNMIILLCWIYIYIKTINKTLYLIKFM